MTSRLLQVPREIRDLIYEYVLVRDIILIERAAATVPEITAKQCPEFYRQLRQSYPLTHIRSHRRVWAIPRFDIGLPSFKDDPELPPSHVQMTYQITRQSSLPFGEQIGIHLLQTCQQIYHEARDIFYAKNVFGFKTVEGIPTAFAFLCDRPAKSLNLISSMQITLGEGTNLRGTTEAHYPIVARSTDSVVLRYAYNDFTNLCTLLSSPRMQLRKLTLVIDSLHQFYRPVFPSPTDCIKWEAQRTTASRPWVAPWVQPLFKVENLECLEIYWSLDRPEICRMADTMSLMRQQMLAPKGFRRHGRSDSFCMPRFDFRINYQVITQERTSIYCELSRNDLLHSDDSKHDDDGDNNHKNNKYSGKLQSSEEKLTRAWRQQIRRIFEISGCFHHLYPPSQFLSIMVTMSSTFSALGDLLQSKPVIVYLALITHYLLHIFDFTIAFYLVLRGWALAFAGLAAIIYTTGQHAGSIAATVQITATVASVYFSVLTASILIYRGFFHRLRKFPGPFGARLSKAYGVYTGVFRTGARYFEWQEELYQKYKSDVIRTGPREVTVYSADAVPLIHGPMSKCVKAESFYGISREASGDSLQTTQDKMEHRQRRKIWDHAFNAKALRDYEPRLNRHALTLISRLKEESSKGPVRITNWLNFYSFDVMGDVGFNRSFGMLEKGKEDEIIKLLHDSMVPLSVGSHIPWALVLALRTSTGAKPLVDHLEWSRKVLEERIKTTPKEKDVFASLLKEGDDQVTRDMITDSRLLIVAGSDTTAATLSFLVCELCSKQDIQAKLREEIDAINPGKAHLDVNDLPECEYLNGVIQETLRLHPAVPSGLLRETPREGLTLPDGTYIPGKVIVQVPTYTIQRDPRYWEKPLDFMPERWFSESPTSVMDKRTFLPFSTGPYNCIGQKLAMIEMRSVVANLVRSFEFAFADGEDGSAVRKKTRDCFTVTVGKLDVKLTPRHT
ncbi:hypothetical protein COCVIDRAFT_42393 [Bipolaris victoriae FI3]|uniref:DUF7730 domain-containing protein n=1 Tax=Bipolaris victoriae (strain FI3) TaxID=930091 RepID=W7E3H1_BIPV3|nr:hypothetical protein COCVIDRAFT_42393 [Bipolaris victoriae FI3]